MAVTRPMSWFASADFAEIAAREGFATVKGCRDEAVDFGFGTRW